MTDEQNFMTTREFSLKTGRSVSSITRMLREGKLKGKKVSGKWLIQESPTPDKPDVSAQSADQTTRYPLDDFARMTFLTPYGVELWLKEGRLIGERDNEGNWYVDAESLKIPNVKRLIRT